MLSERGARGAIGGGLVLVLLLQACLDPIPPDTITDPRPGSASGSVSSLCGGGAIQGADVTAREVLEQGSGASQVTSTDGQGRFEFADLARGTWQLSVSRKGFQTASKSVVVTAGAATPPVKIALSPSSSTTLPSGVKLDVLFVVDNSNSMDQEQKALASAFPSFMDRLMTYKVMLDLRVGVISTDMGAGAYNLPSCETADGDRGKLQHKARTAGCTPPSDPWLAVKGTQTNVPGGMANDAFSCIVQLGTGGCGFEQPLKAIRWALDPQKSKTAGFPRDDSVLAIVVVSDEDDCSASRTQLFDPSQQGLSDPLGPLTSFRCFEFGVKCDCGAGGGCDRTTTGPRKNCVPQAGYLEDVKLFVTQLKQHHSKGKIFFSVIAGPTDKVEVSLSGSNPALQPSCQTSMGFAVPAIRLKAVADTFHPRSSFDSICQVNLKSPMANLAQRIVETALLDPCAK